MERAYHHQHHRERVLRNPRSSLSLCLSLLLSVVLVVPAYKYCISHKDKNKRTNRRTVEKEQGILEKIKKNYFWLSTTATDDDADAARHEHEDTSRRFVRRDGMTYLITRDER